jgi:hypothetical protein
MLCVLYSTLDIVVNSQLREHELTSTVPFQGSIFSLIATRTMDLTRMSEDGSKLPRSHGKIICLVNVPSITQAMIRGPLGQGAGLIVYILMTSLLRNWVGLMLTIGRHNDTVGLSAPCIVQRSLTCCSYSLSISISRFPFWFV